MVLRTSPGKIEMKLNKIHITKLLPRISNITILLFTSADIINFPVQAIPIEIIALSFLCNDRNEFE